MLPTVANDDKSFFDTYEKLYVVTFVDEQGEPWTFVLEFEGPVSRQEIYVALSDQDVGFHHSMTVDWFRLADVNPAPKRKFKYCVEIRRELEDVETEHFEFDEEPSTEDVIQKVKDAGYSFNYPYDDVRFYRV